jgi:hypothetical protein
MSSSHVDNPGEQSDGYHTFNELYEHRHALFILLCATIVTQHASMRSRHIVWRSRQHHDGTMFADHFIMGLFEEPGSQITYHLPISLWDRTGFAETLDKAPAFDGHTSRDVIERLYDLLN